MTNGKDKEIMAKVMTAEQRKVEFYDPVASDLLGQVGKEQCPFRLSIQVSSGDGGGGGGVTGGRLVIRGSSLCLMERFVYLFFGAACVFSVCQLGCLQGHRAAVLVLV